MSDLPAERPDERPATRVSDADRSRVHDILAAAMAQGYLSPTEYETRADKAVVARTTDDLAPLTSNLPVDAIAGSVSATAPPGQAPVQRLIAVMSGAELAGDVAVSGTLTAVAFWGGVSIDLRDARFTTGALDIQATAVMGGIEIVVGPEVEVDIRGVGIMGGFDRRASGPGSSTRGARVTITGAALMGGVSVERKGPAIDTRKKLS
ncbi:DUF1707 SHOCT-like domain-containing protein [Williamsia deligens]|uniref:DUF1707 domain-containing protein n=1 Tax=Williamsia deligens TaxID=321325 RepID=A0ABW3G866_9NOCA|nr:DUF1707 domain-containing protein [Williamsia deligens]MCP2192585.1 protein of unknown function (DUF1707) [Williamsia deligens]